jgi:hypothetical protein
MTAVRDPLDPGIGDCVRCGQPGAPVRPEPLRPLCDPCYDRYLEQRRRITRGPVRDHIQHQLRRPAVLPDFAGCRRLPPVFYGGIP